MAPNAGFFLSPQQKNIWSSAASARSQIALLIEGPFDEARLQSALGEVVKTNESLRVAFQRQTGMKLPFQVVLDVNEPLWTRVTIEKSSNLAATALELMQREASEILPVQLRSTLYTLDDSRTFWIITGHSAVLDAQSIQLLLAKTLEAYSGSEIAAEEPIRYVQFAQWQNDLLAEESEAATDALKFFERADESAGDVSIPGESSGVTPSETSQLSIPYRRNAETVATSLGEDIAAGDVILAAWGAVMARWSGQQRIEVGVVFEGREYEELSTLIGAVSKMVPVSVSIGGQLSFRETVQQVHAEFEAVKGLQEYYPVGKPFKISYEHIVVAPPKSVVSAKFSTLFVRDTAHDCSLTLSAITNESGLELALRYRPEVIGDRVAADIVDSFRSFLDHALEKPEQAVSSLPIVSATRKQEVLMEWNDTSVSLPSSSILSLISSQASLSPSSIAVRSGDVALTYRDLESRSNRLARYLLKHGVQGGSLVGLCVSRSAEMMVPVLAILKAGGAYVPLSADQPKPRFAQQLNGIDVLLTEESFVNQLPEFSGHVVVLDGADRPWEQEPEQAPEIELKSDDLAYVIYTSGSTGTPKGVGVRHGNLLNYASHIVRELELDRQPLQYATVSTLAADLGNTVIYPALMTGGCLHVLDYDVATDSKKMAEYQQTYSIDVLKIVPSHLTALLDGSGTAVLPKKYLILGGEALKSSLVERIGTTCEVINHYGPTETTVGSLMLRLKDYDWKKSPNVPIGRPIANTRVYVLDANRELVPVGVAGELYIAGAGVTSGYVGQPEMTAERFVADPFHAGERMYRTGDLARWLPEGVVEFLGRADDQVKIRGYRVELGEIETVLGSEPGVRQCVVIARPRQDDADDKQVVAYVVLDRQQATTAESLKQSLKQRLPDYMVPSAIVEMTKLPLTSNGKVDRKQLPAPEERAAREYKAPTTTTEELVAQIWSTVLKIDKISTDENFFDLGGHSLLATQVISRIRETFQLEIALRTMFESPVLHDFAAAFDEAKANGTIKSANAPIKRVARQAYRVPQEGS